MCISPFLSFGSAYAVPQDLAQCYASEPVAEDSQGLPLHLSG